MKSGAAAARAGDSAPLRRLGPVSLRRFLEHYWQRKPVCLRQVLTDFTSPVTSARLRELAQDANVESRLVSASSGRWRLRHGPFAQGSLPGAKRAHWTLLVQGVDLHDAAVAALARRFRFLPDARFDDVMISLAGDGGGVGPHVDQYDVFLLQAHGRRRWRIATRYDPALVEGAPLRVLSRFRGEQEWVLDPGDLLYLPPGVAHEGVALGECMTISIGFRLPSTRELFDAWSERHARSASATRRIADGIRAPAQAPARVPAAMIDSALRELRRARPSRLDARRTILEHLSEPRAGTVFEPPRRALDLARFARRAGVEGIALDLRSRMLYEGNDFAFNGELIDAHSFSARLLRDLANQRHLSGKALCSADADWASGFPAQLHEWYRFGWIHLAVK
jgi:50S ribosomal protein L16 3-hydroxylase